MPSEKSQFTPWKEVAAGVLDNTAAFKSTIRPSDVVSQYISRRDSTGSVSYIAKYGVILAVFSGTFKLSPVPPPKRKFKAVAPIDLSIVDILEINGLVSNW